jgi:hypothetical protein
MQIEHVAIADLKPHPRNYRHHPSDQLEHLRQSLRDHGFYRNVITANDLTILAGHGIVEAAKAEGIAEAPILRLPLEPNSPRALKVLAGDNELWHLSENDDRMLADMLKEIKELDSDGLKGTGYDEMMLASLVFVTRHEDEIQDMNEAAHWVGLPGYETGERRIQFIISFRNVEDRAEFAKLIGVDVTDKTRAFWWPLKERNDRTRFRFEPTPPPTDESPA